MAPIHDAIRAGDVEAVRRELAAGVSPDLGDNMVTPLLAAVFRDNVEITLILIEAGADVDLAESSYSPLYVACLHCCKAIVAALIAAGASTSLLTETDIQKIRPIECAGANDRHILWQLLRAGSPLPRLDKATWMQPDMTDGFDATAAGYVNAVAAAGGYVAYEKAHRAKLAAIFAPKLLQLPAEVIPTVVDFWAHLGHP